MEKQPHIDKILPRTHRIYFTRKTERKVFFILTLVMLILGLMAKFGYF